MKHKYTVFKNYRKKTSSLITRNKGELLYILAQYISPFVGLLTNVLLMFYVSPVTIGTHQGYIVWASYMTFLQLGCFNGMYRNLAILKGSDRLYEYKKVASTGFTFSILVCLLSILLVLTLIISNQLLLNSYDSRLAVVALLLMATFQPITSMLDTLYRSGSDFKQLGKIIAIENVLTISTCFIVPLLGYKALVILIALKCTFGTFLRLIFKLNELTIFIDIKILTNQIRTGFPLMINGFLFTSMLLFDQFYIARHFNDETMGYFNLLRLSLLMICVLPNALNSITYPRASLKYARYKKDVNSLKSIYKTALVFNLLYLIPLILTLYFVIPYLVNEFLPDYIEGIKFLHVGLWGGIGYLCVGPTSILATIGKTKFVFLTLSLLIILSYGIYFTGIRMFSCVENLIIFKSVLFIVYSFITILYTYKVITESPESSKKCKL